MVGISVSMTSRHQVASSVIALVSAFFFSTSIIAASASATPTLLPPDDGAAVTAGTTSVTLEWSTTGSFTTPAYLACVTAGSGCLAAVDSSELGTRAPLILIHGWNPAGISAPPLAEAWNNFISYFNADAQLMAAYKLYRFSYFSNSVNLIELGQALRDVLDMINASDRQNFGNKKIVIIGHSLGGLIARYFMRIPQQQGTFAGQNGGDRLLRLITLGTPHHGSPLANGPARNARAGDLWGQALAIFDAEFLASGGPSFNHANRSDLRWDNYDGLLDYVGYAAEQNTILDAMNGDNRYDSRIVAYAGVIGPGDEPAGSVYESAMTVLSGVFGLANDGIIPVASAEFDGHAVHGTRHFPRYNHSELVAGRSTTDPFLFNQMKQDLQIVSAPAGNADCVFNWAERVYPNLFAPAVAVSQTVTVYYYRYYPATNAYLAASSADDHLYYFGPDSNNTIVDAGPLSTWVATANCH